ncbi:MAG: OmpH family outer membrane protein [Proteobacteria bacterium]|jgi:outer membrane protein|nr:OmpH family outer membrane protein [Pseudomonadota bacterium]
MGKWSTLKHTAVLGAILLAASPAKAQASQGKFGVVDMQQVILSVEEGKTARSQLEAEIKAKESELGKQKEELDKMNNEWKNQAALLSEDARMKKQQEFQEKFMTLRNAEMEFQANIKRKEQKATQQIAMKVAQVVDQIAKQKKLVAVFETNSAGLLYLESPVDLTQEVVSEYAKRPKDKAASDSPSGDKKK